MKFLSIIGVLLLSLPVMAQVFYVPPQAPFKDPHQIPNAFEVHNPFYRDPFKAEPIVYKTPRLYNGNGKYLGNLNDNPFDPDSISNPFGRYGNRFSPDSINNPFGAGNPFNPDSPFNLFGKGLYLVY